MVSLLDVLFYRHLELLSFLLFLVFIVELIHIHLKEQLKVSIGSIVAFLTSSIAQAIIMFIMIVWFFIDALLIN